MAIAPLSREQFELIEYSNARINIAHGPVRAGKNFAENIRIRDYFIKEPVANPDSTFVFAGVSSDSVQEIILKDLSELVGYKNYKYSSHSKKGSIYGRPFRVFDFKDADAFSSLRGRTLGGALLTEGTLCHKSFFDELMNRLSIENSKCFIDTNPDSPYHWLAQELVFNEEKIKNGLVKSFPFNFDSNLSLADEYKNFLKSYYKPGSLLYKRMILGLWVLADGVIYDNFSDLKNTIEPEDLPKRFDAYYICGDFGTNNPCVFLLVGRVGNTLYVIKEYYYEGRKEAVQKTPEEYTADLKEFVSNIKIDGVYLDPSATPLIVAIKKLTTFNIKEVDNSVLEGIATVSNLFNQGRVIVSKSCINLIREIHSYIWDVTASMRTGKDTPKKQWDHAADALRYLCQSLYGKTVGNILNARTGQRRVTDFTKVTQ